MRAKRKPIPEKEVERIRNWVAINRGLLTVIAVQFNVTPQFVQQCAYGRDTAGPNHMVKSALRDKGWEPPRRSNA